MITQITHRPRHRHVVRANRVAQASLDQIAALVAPVIDPYLG
jgi:hypothetical protein